MTLYFDTYITDIPLNNNFVELRKIENSIKSISTSYKPQTRLDIVKYTLTSYSKLNWNNVIIKYELQDSSLIPEFDNFILNLFPKAIIFHNRSDSQKKYAESIKLLDELKDEWIFYAPNNDHVFISNNINIFDNLLIKANSLKSKFNNNISIIYSHFSESICSIRKGHLINNVYNLKSNIIEEDDDCFVSYYPKGNLDSIQVIHIDLMKKWFLSVDFKDRKIIRAESLVGLIEPISQIVITPKCEICRHYDGYMHTIYGGRLVYISPNKVPPLFIPDGFFSKSIKIAYGYDDYRVGWVNINPTKNNYIFQDDKFGTDLKMTINEIPQFWIDRISTVDYSKDIILDDFHISANKNLRILNDPWGDINMFRIKLFIFFKWVRWSKNVFKKYFKLIIIESVFKIK